MEIPDVGRTRHPLQAVDLKRNLVRLETLSTMRVVPSLINCDVNLTEWDTWFLTDW